MRGRRGGGPRADLLPREAGTEAVAAVLSSRTPRGRPPVSIPARPGVQPSTYLAARLAGPGEVSSTDPTPAFGHGIGHTTFSWTDLEVERAAATTDGTVELAFALHNTGGRSDSETVQLYLHDPVAGVVQPVQRLIGYRRITLDPSQESRVRVSAPAGLASFTGCDGRHIVEPGELELRIAASSTDVRLAATVRLDSPVRVLDHTRRLHADFRSA